MGVKMRRKASYGISKAAASCVGNVGGSRNKGRQCSNTIKSPQGTISSGDVLEKQQRSSQDVVWKKPVRPQQQCMLCLKFFHRKRNTRINKLAKEDECDECTFSKWMTTPSAEDDGSAITNRSRRACRRQVVIKEEAPAKGDSVEVNWKNKGTYYPAVITTVHPDGSCEVVFDDKSTMYHVNSDLISIVERTCKERTRVAVQPKKGVKQEMGKVFNESRFLEPKKSERPKKHRQLRAARSSCTRSPQKEVEPANSNMDIEQEMNRYKRARKAKEEKEVVVEQQQQQQQLNSQGHHHSAAERNELGSRSNLEVAKKRKYTGIILSHGTWIARETWGLYSERKIIGRYDTQLKAAKAYDAHRVKYGRGQAVNVPEEFDPDADQLRLVDTEEEKSKNTRQLRYIKEWMNRNFDSNGKFCPEIIVPPPSVGTHDDSFVRSDGKTTHDLW